MIKFKNKCYKMVKVNSAKIFYALLKQSNKIKQKNQDIEERAWFNAHFVKKPIKILVLLKNVALSMDLSLKEGPLLKNFVIFYALYGVLKSILPNNYSLNRLLNQSVVQRTKNVVFVYKKELD